MAERFTSKAALFGRQKRRGYVWDYYIIQHYVNQNKNFASIC